MLLLAYRLACLGGVFLESGNKTHTHISSPTVSLCKLWKSAAGGLLIKPLRSVCMCWCEFVRLALRVCGWHYLSLLMLEE